MRVLKILTSHFSADRNSASFHFSTHSQMYHIQHLLLTCADICCAYRCSRRLGDLHLFSKCASSEVLLLGFRVFVGGLANADTSMGVCVCVCASVRILSFCS